MYTSDRVDEKTLLPLPNLQAVQFGSNFDSEGHFCNVHLALDFFGGNVA